MRSIARPLLLGLAGLITTCGASVLLARGATPDTITIRFAPLQVGDSIEERLDDVDRIDWRLPPEKLQRFAAAGVIINEERRSTVSASGRVVHAGANGSTVRVNVHVDELDVPRKTTSRATTVADIKLSPSNEPITSGPLALEDAATFELPFRSGSLAHVGQRWQTHVLVSTELGSGETTFDHEVFTIDGSRIGIRIHGRGKITGAQYHLPKLLPGTIDLDGAAWYDATTGFVAQGSYAIHNTLLKSPHGQEVGFDERRSVDVTTWLARSATRLES